MGLDLMGLSAKSVGEVDCSDWSGAAIVKTVRGSSWLRRAQRRQMALHLLAGCESCAAKVRSELAPPLMASSERTEREPEDNPLFERALRRLEEMERPAQELFLNGVPGLRSADFVRWLAFKCRRLVTWDPERAVRLGRLCVLAADGLHTNVRALAAMRMGQALRRARGDYLGADTWFAKARELLSCEPDADPFLLAKLLRLQGYSRFVQSRSAEAVPLFEEALSIYRRAGDLEGAGKTMADMAGAVEETQGSKEAIGLLLKACGFIDFEKNPRFALMIAQNLSVFHGNLGNTDQAVAYLGLARDLLEQQGDAPADALRMDWSAGRILAQAGRTSESVPVLREARDRFIELGLAAEAGQISLDLALSLLQLGRTAELKEIAHEMLPIFRSRLLHAEALAAIEFFREAVMAETITAGQIHAIADFLVRLESDKTVRFKRPS